MKKISLLFVVAFVAVACQPDLPPVPATKTGTTSTTTTTGTTAATSGTTSSTGSTTASSTTGSTTSSTTGTTGKTSSSTTTGSSTSTSGSTTSTTTASTSQKPQPGDIPNRIFQLRELAHATITGGNQPIDAFVADDDIKAAEGLMWVTDKDLKDGQGMIFIMSSSKVQSFWMQNTLIPLDIIYIGTDGKVVNIVHGKPKDETSLPSTGPALYVLELKDGMAAKFGISGGTKLTIPTTLKYRGDQNQNQNQGGISIPGGG